jgi:hypothetical protein
MLASITATLTVVRDPETTDLIWEPFVHHVKVCVSGERSLGTTPAPDAVKSLFNTPSARLH